MEIDMLDWLICVLFSSFQYNFLFLEVFVDTRGQIIVKIWNLVV